MVTRLLRAILRVLPAGVIGTWTRAIIANGKEVTKVEYYIYITGKVAKGSGIIITQIWNSLRGKKVQHICPHNSDNMDNVSTISRPTMTPTTLTSSKPTTKTIKTLTPTRSATTAIPTRSTISTTIMQIKNITATTSSQIPTRFKTSKWNSTINISKLSGQKTTTTIVKSYYQTTATVLPSKSQATLLPVRNMTPKSGNNPESMTHNVHMGKTDVEIEKEKTKKMIIGSVLGAVVFTILMIFLTIMVIIKKQRKQMNNLPFSINVIVVGNQSATERNGNLAREILLPRQS